MRLTRVHVDAALEPGASLTIEGDAANHIARVLRLRVGDALTLFDGRGGEHAGRISAMRRRGVLVEVGEHRPLERESPLRLTLLQAVARGERMDLIVQKATELGTARIVPVLTERTVVRLAGDQAAKKRAHWQAVAVAACEQCGRNRIPEVAQPLAVAEALAAEAGLEAAGALKLLLDPESRVGLSDRIGRGAARIVLLVGPEGGLTEEERRLAVRSGFDGVRMGARVLRTETAALAGVAAIQTLAGDLGA